LNLLLDTYTWLWSLEDHKRLGKRVQEELRSPGNQIWLSPAEAPAMARIAPPVLRRSSCVSPQPIR
jgi:PIN domain nuclease of toxin-antitoxin system